MVVTVSDASAGRPVENVAIQVSGPTLGTPVCAAGAGATVCTIPGEGGSYTLVVGAPGFVSDERSVIVKSSGGQCGCPAVATEGIAVALTPSS